MKKGNKVSPDLKSDYEKFMSLYPDSAYISKVVFVEGSKYSAKRPELDLGFDQIYVTQHQFAMRWLTQIIAQNPGSFASRDTPEMFHAIDIGSQFDFVLTMSAFINFIIVDPSLDLGKNDIVTAYDIGALFTSQEGQNLSLINDEDVNLLTSLHAIEHFGLGRYGDTLDPEGDVKALKEFNRVLSTGGYFIGSVPIEQVGRERVDFNKNRIYSIPLIQRMLFESGFAIDEHVCAVSVDAIKKGLPSNPEHQYPAAHMNPTEFPHAMSEIVLESHGDLNNQPNAAYVWLARKTRKV